MSEKSQQWHSLHVFLHDRDNTVAFIARVLAPLLDKYEKNEAIECWFFIRYWEGGPHIRIRFKSVFDIAQQIQDTLKSAVSPYLSATPLNANSYYENHSFDGEPVDRNQLVWYDEGEVVFIPYVPEYQRYGGEHAVLINEQLFCASSKIATVILRESLEHDSVLIGSAIKYMLLSAYALDPELEQIKLTMHYYGMYWKGFAASIAEIDQLGVKSDQFTEMIVSNFNRTEPKLNPLDQFWLQNIRNSIHRCRQLYEQGRLFSPLSNRQVDSEQDCHEAIANIIGSQMHMLNNRLGISPEQEYIFANKIELAIAQCEGIST